MLRYKALLLLILVPVLLAFGPAVGAQDAGQDYPRFEGIWETDLGRMALWQANDAVWGIYSGYGEIGGHIEEDGVFRFWYEDDPDDEGTGWFALNDDGQGFYGFYYSSIEPSVHGRWEGTLLGPNNYEISDRDALNYEPGEEYVPPTDGGPEVPPSSAPPEVSVPATDESETEVSTTAWTGTWDTGRGYLVLAVSESTIYGSFGEEGIIEGELAGDTLSATWSVTLDDGTIDQGEALFTIAEDGASFRGTYNRSDDPNLWLPWIGTKLTDQITSFVIEEEETSPLTQAGNIEETTPVEPVEAVEAEPEEVVEETVEEQAEPVEETEEEALVYEILLTATGDCWVTLRGEDGESFVGMMQEGDEVELTDSIGFYLRAGRPECLIVEFNGEIIEWETGQVEMILPPDAEITIMESD